MALRTIVVEDDAYDAEFVVAALTQEGYDLDLIRVTTAEELERELAASPPDLVVSDYVLPFFSAEDALRCLHATGHDVPFILISGRIGEDAAVAMMRAGAHDYVSKDHLYRLGPAVRRELREAQSRAEQRLAREALRRTEEDLRLLAEHVPDVIFRCRVHPRLEVAYLSPAVEMLSGVAPEALLGEPGRFMSHIIDSRERAALEESWRTGQSTSMIVRWRQPDGATAWLEQRAQAIHENGNAVAVEGILRDVTERILRQREHEILLQQLHQSERLESLGLLAGGVAHDFNNALAVIINSAEFLAEDLPPDLPSRNDLDNIRNAANRSAALTSQLLLFARRQPEPTEVVDVNDLATGIEPMIRRTIGEDVEFSCATTSAPAPVALDRSKLEQIILNLAGNSRAAMPNGGSLRVETELIEVPGGPEVTGTELADGRYVRLSVADSGLGMSPEVALRVFDPFFTTKPPGEGTGLGLATAYAVVHQAGGTIAVESMPGQGTVVRIHLPLCEAPTATAAPSSTEPVLGRGETIMVVEDDDAVRDTIARVLCRHRYEVIAATGPAEALSRLATPDTTVDLILTDIVMPGMNGRQLAQHLRDLRPGVPILFMSGYAATVPPETAAQQHIEIIDKPFTHTYLLARLRVVLNERAEGRAAAPGGRSHGRSRARSASAEAGRVTQAGGGSPVPGLGASLHPQSDP